jgi:hypothetical protein
VHQQRWTLITKVGTHKGPLRSPPPIGVDGDVWESVGVGAGGGGWR